MATVSNFKQWRDLDDRERLNLVLQIRKSRREQKSQIGFGKKAKLPKTSNKRSVKKTSIDKLTKQQALDLLRVLQGEQK